MNIGDDDVPERARSTVVRTEPNGVLLFNSVSDEMFFVSNAAHRVFELCTGTLTVEQIEMVLTCHNDDLDSSTVREFLQQLVDRGILVVRKPQVIKAVYAPASDCSSSC